MRLGWNLLREDLSLPSAVLYRDRLEHNLAWMQRFMDAYKVRLAPHGKTTMAPRLFEMQLKSGAWGITLASAHQAMVAHAHGVSRVLMANQLVGKQNMETIAALLTDPEFEFYCLVDSAAGVDLLGEFFSARGLRLNVLLELGVMGGRCGVRDDAQLEAVLECVGPVERHDTALRSGALRRRPEGGGRNSRVYAASLQGNAEAAGSEGIRARAGPAFGRGISMVRRGGGGIRCRGLRRCGGNCAAAGMLPHPRRRQLRDAAEANPRHRIRLRARCAPGSCRRLHVWAYVQSIPEAELAVVGMGRRDAAFDSGLPTPALHFRPGS